jgi:putative transposase
MKAIELAAIYERPRTSLPAGGTHGYPYLLRGREVASPDEVWRADVTYIPTITSDTCKRDDRAG